MISHHFLAEEFNLLHPLSEDSVDFQRWLSRMGSVLLWGAQGNGTGWLVLRGAPCGARGRGHRGTAVWDSLWHPEGRQAAFWGHQASPSCLCRSCGISLTPRVPSQPITCSTSSLASDPVPSPSPPPCW